MNPALYFINTSKTYFFTQINMSDLQSKIWLTILLYEVVQMQTRLWGRGGKNKTSMEFETV